MQAKTTAMDINGQEEALYEDVPYILVYSIVSYDKPMLPILGISERSNSCKRFFSSPMLHLLIDREMLGCQISIL